MQQNELFGIIKEVQNLKVEKTDLGIESGKRWVPQDIRYSLIFL